jgi:hypothetical protein
LNKVIAIFILGPSDRGKDDAETDDCSVGEMSTDAVHHVSPSERWTVCLPAHPHRWRVMLFGQVGISTISI